jgi:hypothetical protein
VRFTGFSSAEWVRLAELFRGAKAQHGAEKRGGVVALSDGRRLLKLVHTRRGRLDPMNQQWPSSLAALADEQAADWALEIQQTSLRDLADRFARGLKPEHDYLKQTLDLLDIVRDYAALGRFKAWPPRLVHWPVPSYPTVQRAMDALCPGGKSIVVGVFHEGDLYTALAARRRDSGFDAVLGPAVLRPRMGLLSGEWSRDYRHVLTAVEQELGPVYQGFFAEFSCLRRLLENDEPGSFARAVALRDLIIAPAGPVLAVPLAVDTARATLRAARRLVSRARSSGRFDSTRPWAKISDRVQAANLSGWEVADILGFDPLALIKKLVERH